MEQSQYYVESYTYSFIAFRIVTDSVPKKCKKSFAAIQIMGRVMLKFERWHGVDGGLFEGIDGACDPVAKSLQTHGMTRQRECFATSQHF